MTPSPHQFQSESRKKFAFALSRNSVLKVTLLKLRRSITYCTQTKWCSKSCFNFDQFIHVRLRMYLYGRLQRPSRRPSVYWMGVCVRMELRLPILCWSWKPQIVFLNYPFLQHARLYVFHAHDKLGWNPRGPPFKYALVLVLTDWWSCNYDGDFVFGVIHNFLC